MDSSIFLVFNIIIFVYVFFPIPKSLHDIYMRDFQSNESKKALHGFEIQINMVCSFKIECVYSLINASF